MKASCSEAVNRYQRPCRPGSDLVNTVKGEANFEQSTLTQVIEARSKASPIQATPELINDPQALQNFSRREASSPELPGRARAAVTTLHR